MSFLGKGPRISFPRRVYQSWLLLVDIYKKIANEKTVMRELQSMNHCKEICLQQW
jgi:hypothetical protein